MQFNNEQWYVSNCPACDCTYAITKRMEDHRRKDGGTFYCPNGHSMTWSNTEADKLRRERDRLKQDAARLNDELVAERKRADEAEKKNLQIRKRAAAGVCPCCNRTFLNVQRHMKSKHPNVIPIEQKTA